MMAARATIAASRMAATASTLASHRALHFASIARAAASNPPSPSASSTPASSSIPVSQLRNSELDFADPAHRSEMLLRSRAQRRARLWFVAALCATSAVVTAYRMVHAERKAKEAKEREEGEIEATRKQIAAMKQSEEQRQAAISAAIDSLVPAAAASSTATPASASADAGSDVPRSFLAAVRRDLRRVAGLEELDEASLRISPTEPSLTPDAAAAPKPQVEEPPKPKKGQRKAAYTATNSVL